MPVKTEPTHYVCLEPFAATLEAGDVWFKLGQRVSAEHEIFKGESGRNRRERLFEPAEEAGR